MDGERAGERLGDEGKSKNRNKQEAVFRTLKRHKEFTTAVDFQ